MGTRLPDGTEVVLAERTRPFHASDTRDFFPLMRQVEACLGRRPRFGTWDAAYDAFYVDADFHEAGGFAAVPFDGGGRRGLRAVAPDGAPQCAAGGRMTRLFTYQHRIGLVAHERETCGGPLLHLTPSGAPCPIDDPHCARGGCTTTLATSVGARLRHPLDRTSPAYQQLYTQRTMVERLNNQAEALGILRPKLRRGQAIGKLNTLIYVLINLRALARRPAAAAQERPTTLRQALSV